MSNVKILFILKYREVKASEEVNFCWNEQDKIDLSKNKELSSGLLNSSRFLTTMLSSEGIDVKLVQVIDNNSIDREVSLYKPTHVIIEALWVVPEKFEVLKKLHPNVIWIVRGHSEIPFLAQEGIAMDWITKYVSYDNVRFAANSKNSYRDLSLLMRSVYPDSDGIDSKIINLPNFYPYKEEYSYTKKKEDEYLDVACFGAIRPLKNQLIQAVAAIEYARLSGKKLRFHTNATRIETQGDSVLKNLEALFESTPEHELIKHSWMPHDTFIELLYKMDIAMQVSFSETFNIVAADCVVVGLPIVASPEIAWITPWCKAEPTNAEDIILKLIKINDWRLKSALKILNKRGLQSYCENSKLCWLNYFNHSY